MGWAELASQFIFIDIVLVMDPVSAMSIASSSITFVQFEDGQLKTIYSIFGVGRDVQ
jgi:hypothetical protein